MTRLTVNSTERRSVVLVGHASVPYSRTAGLILVALLCFSSPYGERKRRQDNGEINHEIISGWSSVITFLRYHYVPRLCRIAVTCSERALSQWCDCVIDDVTSATRDVINPDAKRSISCYAHRVSQTRGAATEKRRLPNIGSLYIPLRPKSKTLV